MKIDEIRYALKNVMSRRLRSFLSVLSILIGITAIFALISFGMGIQHYVDQMAAEAGTDKLFLQSKGIGAPGTDENFVLTQDDLDFVSKINGVEEITGMYFSPAEISFKEQNKYNYLIGMDVKKTSFIMEGFNVDIVKGRELKKGDIYKVVLGYNYQIENKIFDKAVNIGDKLELDEVVFDVIGFYSEVGNPSDDSQIYITSEAFEQMYPDKKEEYGFIYIRSEKDVEPQDLADKIEEKLRKHKGQEEGKEDFYVQTFEDALETFGNVITILNGILVLIALISLIVASVNIMNTMYTAVLERTKEIGVMKAVGAKNSDIMLVFIFESGFLGMVGGIVGVFLGYVVASIGGAAAAAAGYALLKPIFPLSLIFGCIAFSFFVGAIAGVMPAIRASKLKPVDALRYE